MPIPHVTFSIDSATSYDCIAWAAKSIIAGQLSAEAMADIPAACRALYRVADDITERVSGPTVWGDTPADLELRELATALGIAPANFATAEGDPAGISPIVLQLMLAALAKLIEKLLADNES